MRFFKGKILNPSKCDKNGHVGVWIRGLENEKKVVERSVHRLVMLAFVGLPPKGKEVRHINGIPTDNRLKNLVYGTRTENILDVYYQRKKLA